MALQKDPRHQQPELAEPLTECEIEILRLIADGWTDRKIGQQLVLSVDTVKWSTDVSVRLQMFWDILRSKLVNHENLILTVNYFTVFAGKTSVAHENHGRRQERGSPRHSLTFAGLVFGGEVIADRVHIFPPLIDVGSKLKRPLTTDGHPWSAPEFFSITRRQPQCGGRLAV